MSGKLKKTKADKLKLNKSIAKDLSVSTDKQKNIRGGAGAGSRIIVRGTTCCWVARAVYGEANPRWLLFREWLLADAPGWFRSLYIRHGERFARWIAPYAGVKSIIRHGMDSVVDRKFGGGSVT